MFRKLFLFVSAMIILPIVFGIKAVWFTQTWVDSIMIIIGIFMMIAELNKMDNKKIS